MTESPYIQYLRALTDAAETRSEREKFTNMIKREEKALKKREPVVYRLTDEGWQFNWNLITSDYNKLRRDLLKRARKVDRKIERSSAEAVYDVLLESGEGMLFDELQDELLLSTRELHEALRILSEEKDVLRRFQRLAGFEKPRALVEEVTLPPIYLDLKESNDKKARLFPDAARYYLDIERKGESDYAIKHRRSIVVKIEEDNVYMPTKKGKKRGRKKTTPSEAAYAMRQTFEGLRAKKMKKRDEWHKKLLGRYK